MVTSRTGNENWRNIKGVFFNPVNKWFIKSRLTYIDGNGDIIELLQGTLISNSQIDTEDATVIDIEINGNQGLLAEKDEEVIVGWSEKKASLILRGNIEKSILLKVAESIEGKE